MYYIFTNEILKNIFIYSICNQNYRDFLKQKYQNLRSCNNIVRKALITLYPKIKQIKNISIIKKKLYAPCANNKPGPGTFYDPCRDRCV